MARMDDKAVIGQPGTRALHCVRKFCYNCRRIFAITRQMNIYDLTLIFFSLCLYN